MFITVVDKVYNYITIFINTAILFIFTYERNTMHKWMSLIIDWSNDIFACHINIAKIMSIYIIIRPPTHCRKSFIKSISTKSI